MLFTTCTKKSTTATKTACNRDTKVDRKSVARRKLNRALNLERCEQRQMFASDVLVGEFDGVPGEETAIVRDQSITFMNSAGRTTTLGIDNWSRAIQGEVDGRPGNEVVLLPRATSGFARVQVVSLAKQSVVSYTVNGFANARIEDLDGFGGNEILALSSVSGLDQRVVVLKPTTGAQFNYQVSTNGNVEVQDLDGQPGRELMFDSGTNRQDRTFTVIQSQTNRLDKFNIPQTGGWQLRELDQRLGLEILVSNLTFSTSSGFTEARTTIFNYGRKTIWTYDIGRATELQVRDLDADGDLDIFVSDLSSINSGKVKRTVSTIDPKSGRKTDFDIGLARDLVFKEIDGSPGEEAVATNLSKIDDFPQPAQAIVVDFNSLAARTFELGRPTNVTFGDLDKNGTLELIATDLSSVKSGERRRTLTVVDPGRNWQKSFDVGFAMEMQFAELDGATGDELVFGSITRAAGEPIASQAVVYTHTTRDITVYDGGAARWIEFRELDGQPGQEMLFTNVGSTYVATTGRFATVITHRQREAKTYLVGIVDSFNIRELDGQPGAEISFVGTNTVSILNARERRVDSYAMPKLQYVLYTPIDSVPGDELVVVTSTGRFIIFAGLRKVVRA